MRKSRDLTAEIYNFKQEGIKDTQIISYCFSGHWESTLVNNAEISSVTASEFLLFHTREDSQVDYYVISPEKFHYDKMRLLYAEYAKNSKWAKRGAKRTDSIIINFGSHYSPYRMFGNDAITSIINNKDFRVFKMSISHLKKAKQKLLNKKMEFILDNNILCYRINENICKISMNLLDKFEKNITPKDNIKNTINDLLILSTAIEYQKVLHTKDKVLNEFVTNMEMYKGTIKSYSNDTVYIDFRREKIKINHESKRYINKGWTYSFSKK